MQTLIVKPPAATSAGGSVPECGAGASEVDSRMGAAFGLGFRLGFGFLRDRGGALGRGSFALGATDLGDGVGALAAGQERGVELVLRDRPGVHEAGALPTLAGLACERLEMGE